MYKQWCTISHMMWCMCLLPQITNYDIDLNQISNREKNMKQALKFMFKQSPTGFCIYTCILSAQCLTQTACPLGSLWRHWSPQAWEFQSPSLWGHQHWSVCLLPRWRVSGNHLQLLWPVKTTHFSHLTINTDYSLCVTFYK